MSAPTVGAHRAAAPAPRGFARLGAFTVARRRTILVVALLFVVIAGAVGGGRR